MTGKVVARWFFEDTKASTVFRDLVSQCQGIQDRNDLRAWTNLKNLNEFVSTIDAWIKPAHLEQLDSGMTTREYE